MRKLSNTIENYPICKNFSGTDQNEMFILLSDVGGMRIKKLKYVFNIIPLSRNGLFSNMKTIGYLEV